MDEEFTAFHEAGHAVIGYRLNLLGNSVTIIPDFNKGIDGCCDQEDWDLYPESVCKQIITLYAGEAAAKRRFPDYTGYSGAEGDFESAMDLLRYAAEGTTDAELHSKTDSLVEDNWPYICAVAEELMQAKTLSSEEYEIIIDSLDLGRDWKEILNTFRKDFLA